MNTNLHRYEHTSRTSKTNLQTDCQNRLFGPCWRPLLGPPNGSLGPPPGTLFWDPPTGPPPPLYIDHFLIRNQIKACGVGRVWESSYSRAIGFPEGPCSTLLQNPRWLGRATCTKTMNLNLFPKTPRLFDHRNFLRELYRQKPTAVWRLFDHRNHQKGSGE